MNSPWKHSIVSLNYYFIDNTGDWEMVSLISCPSSISSLYSLGLDAPSSSISKSHCQIRKADNSSIPHGNIFTIIAICTLSGYFCAIVGCLSTMLPWSPSPTAIQISLESFCFAVLVLGICGGHCGFLCIFVLALKLFPDNGIRTIPNIYIYAYSFWSCIWMIIDGYAISSIGFR